jgi:hypothetical protein
MVVQPLLTYVEFGEVSIVTPNTQLPTPNTQLPTPNSQLPTIIPQLVLNSHQFTVKKMWKIGRIDIAQINQPIDEIAD